MIARQIYQCIRVGNVQNGLDSTLDEDGTTIRSVGLERIGQEKGVPCAFKKGGKRNLGRKQAQGLISLTIQNRRHTVVLNMSTGPSVLGLKLRRSSKMGGSCPLLLVGTSI